MMGVPGIHDVKVEDRDRAFRILLQLRPSLDRASFEQQLAQWEYRLIGTYTPLLSALIGMRLIEASPERGRHLNVDDLVVAETQRGQGLGRALLSFAEAEARRVHCVEMCTEVSDDMVPFFEKHGFEQSGSGTLCKSLK